MAAPAVGSDFFSALLLTRTSLQRKLVRMNDPLREAEGRLQRYWNVDGLHEIGVALILSLTALWVWASDLSDLPRTWRNGFSMSFPILVCGGIAAEGWMVKAIRRRLTYPRAGFAELRKPPRTKRIWTALLGMFVATAIAAAIATNALASFDLRRWSMALLGIGMAALLWQVGSRSQLPRFRMLAALIAALGVAIAATNWPFEIGIVAFFGMAGAAFLVSGGITLWRFLHT
jgi:hypothetical protein